MLDRIAKGFQRMGERKRTRTDQILFVNGECGSMEDRT